MNITPQFGSLFIRRHWDQDSRQEHYTLVQCPDSSGYIQVDQYSIGVSKYVERTSDPDYLNRVRSLDDEGKTEHIKKLLDESEITFKPGVGADVIFPEAKHKIMVDRWPYASMEDIDVFHWTGLQFQFRRSLPSSEERSKKERPSQPSASQQD